MIYLWLRKIVGELEARVYIASSQLCSASEYYVPRVESDTVS